MAVELPVRNDIKSYSFTTDLDGTTYTFDFDYNYRKNEWAMAVSDEQGNPYVSGIPVLEGLDLLRQYVTPGLPPGAFFAIDTTGKGVNPDLTNFGSDVRLIYLESADIGK